MFRMSLRAAVIAIGAVLLVSTVSPALAIFPELRTELSGPAINGVVPRGEATVDQSGLPQLPCELDVSVSNVNLPDGTVLAVEMRGVIVGTFTLSSGQGHLFTTLDFQVGRQDDIFVRHGDTLILSATAPWEV